MDSYHPIQKVLTAVRRRRLAMLLLDQGLFALSLAMAAFALLLLLGTQVLDWYWPAAVFAIALVFGIWRTMTRLPARYRLLQEVDQRLGLHDALSTAWFFSDAASARAGSEVRAKQNAQAAEIARSVDVKSAVPFRAPRTLYAATACIVVAASLFGLRYGVRGNLDLGPPAIEALAHIFRPTEEMIESWEKAEVIPPEDPEKPAASRQERREGRFDRDADSRLTAVEQPGAEADSLSPNTDRPSDGEADPWNEGREAAPPEGDATPGADETPPGAESDEGSPESEEAERERSQDENDLLRKMQDAFANLLNKLQLEAPEVKGRRMVSRERETEAGGKEGGQKQGEQGDGRPEGEGSPTDDPNGQQAQKGGQMAQAGQGEAQSDQGGQPGQQSSQSGAGKKDGDKDIRLAQQLEAMGKIEEILGKRAENLKGDIMVEVSSGPQRLRTAYTETEATHGAAGAEVYRDEIPLELQPYVERYFTEIRRADREAEARERPAPE